MAGRKPLPTQLKLVKNTARPHRVNKVEPKPERGFGTMSEVGQIMPFMRRQN